MAVGLGKTKGVRPGLLPTTYLLFTRDSRQLAQLWKARARRTSEGASAATGATNGKRSCLHAMTIVPDDPQRHLSMLWLLCTCLVCHFNPV